MKPCPRCNHEAQEDQAECPNCGVVFAKWYATHSSSPTPVSTSASATGKFTLRHLKYLISFLIVAAIFVGLGSIGMSARKDRRIKEEMVNVKDITIAPILTALEKYYQKNGRFPVSTTATTVTSLMSGTLDKGPDVWTSMELDRYPVFRNTARGSLVSQLDYTSDASGSTMTLRLTMANFATDSIDGKIISVTPSPEKETVITWTSNCSFQHTYCVDPNPFCRIYPSSPACR